MMADMDVYKTSKPAAAFLDSNRGRKSQSSQGSRGYSLPSTGARAQKDSLLKNYFNAKKNLKK